MRAAAPPFVPRAARGAALAVLAILVLTVDTRSYGLIPDGKEMLSATAAVARFFEIGISRDFVNAPRRPAGDAVSRYGMGLSLAEVVPGTVTRVLRAAAPSVPSAPVLVLLPIACLVAAAWATGRSANLLGAAPGWAAASGAGLVLATPLWGYAASDYGEPLQTLCVSLAVLGVVELRANSTSRRWQIVLGVAAGFAILSKTLLLVAVAPLLACALLGRKEERDFSEGKRADAGHRATRAAQQRRGGGAGSPFASYEPPWPLLSSFSALLLVWAVFEFARFGKLFGGYAGETFSYPFLTGLLRLTVLPNKGLFWYAPVVLLAPLGFFALRRRDLPLALACAASAASLLFAACAWWAWDGQAGWGPRLLLPALPPLLVFAGQACSGSARPVRVAGALALALGAGVNLLGALVPFPAVYALSSVVAPQPIPERRADGHRVRDRTWSRRRASRDGAPSPVAHALLVADPRSRAASRGETSGRGGGGSDARKVSHSSIRLSDRSCPKIRPSRCSSRWGRSASGGGANISLKGKRKRDLQTPGPTLCATRRFGRST